MTAQADLRDGVGKTRRLSAAEKVLFGLARGEGKTIWWCTTHPLFVRADGICPHCGKRGQVFEPEKMREATNGAA